MRELHAAETGPSVRSSTMLIPKAHKVAVYSKLFQGELQRAAGSSLREKNFSLRCPLRVPRPPWGPASSTHGNKTRYALEYAVHAAAGGASVGIAQGTRWQVELNSALACGLSPEPLLRPPPRSC